MADTTLRVTAVRDPSEVRVFETWGDEERPRERALAEIRAQRVFEAHPGWRGYIERAPR
jgi:hypothetical protein